MKMGNKIKQYRESKKMTQKEIAEILEVEPATISKYESGIIEPSIESLKKLSNIFDVTIDELVKDDVSEIALKPINILEILTEDMIKEFHKILKTGTTGSQKEWFNVWGYKKLLNTVGEIKTVAPKDVAKQMEKLLSWYNSLENITINEIIEFHAKFEKIHPFQDGNGRIGRIIAFKECLNAQDQYEKMIKSYLQ